MMQQKTGKCNRLPCPEGRGLRSRLVNRRSTMRAARRRLGNRRTRRNTASSMLRKSIICLKPPSRSRVCAKSR